jgi:hypothetical protein
MNRRQDLKAETKTTQEDERHNSILLSSEWSVSVLTYINQTIVVQNKSFSVLQSSYIVCESMCL